MPPTHACNQMVQEESLDQAGVSGLMIRIPHNQDVHKKVPSWRLERIVTWSDNLTKYTLSLRV